MDGAVGFLYVVALIGCYFALRYYRVSHPILGTIFWPVTLVVLGVLALIRLSSSRSAGGPPPVVEGGPTIPRRSYGTVDPGE